VFGIHIGGRQPPGSPQVKEHTLGRPRAHPGRGCRSTAPPQNRCV